jgi:hypothetical protein
MSCLQITDMLEAIDHKATATALGRQIESLCSTVLHRPQLYQHLQAVILNHIVAQQQQEHRAAGLVLLQPSREILELIHQLHATVLTMAQVPNAVPPATSILELVCAVCVPLRISCLVMPPHGLPSSMRRKHKTWSRF